MERAGSSSFNMVAKIAGGAQMFSMAGASSQFNIGERNVEAVKKALYDLKIPIIAQDVGLNFGRTVFFYTEDGKMEVKSTTQGVKVL